MAEAAAEPEPTWALAVEPAPLHAKLLLSIAPAAGMLTRQEEPVLKLFMNLAQRGLEGSIVTVEDFRTKLMWGELRAEAKKAGVSAPTLKTIGRLIEPSPTGFQWKQSEATEAKRGRGGNGNNKPTQSLKEQLEAEGVEPLNAATFEFSAVTWEGIPRKGQAATLDASIPQLFDQMWLTQNAIPQLRTYLRGADVRGAVFDWIDANLAPPSEAYLTNRKGLPVTLSQRCGLCPSLAPFPLSPLPSLAPLLPPRRSSLAAPSPSPRPLSSHRARRIGTQSLSRICATRARSSSAWLSRRMPSRSWTSRSASWQKSAPCRAC